MEIQRVHANDDQPGIFSPHPVDKDKTTRLAPGRARWGWRQRGPMTRDTPRRRPNYQVETAVDLTPAYGGSSRTAPGLNRHGNNVDIPGKGLDGTGWRQINKKPTAADLPRRRTRHVVAYSGNLEYVYDDPSGRTLIQKQQRER